MRGLLVLFTILCAAVADAADYVVDVSTIADLEELREFVDACSDLGELEALRARIDSVSDLEKLRPAIEELGKVHMSGCPAGFRVP